MLEAMEKKCWLHAKDSLSPLNVCKESNSLVVNANTPLACCFEGCQALAKPCWILGPSQSMHVNILQGLLCLSSGSIFAAAVSACAGLNAN